VSIALGSHGELATCIDLCVRLGFFKQAEVTRLFALSNSVGRLLNGLYRSLEAKLLQESELKVKRVVEAADGTFRSRDIDR